MSGRVLSSCKGGGGDEAFNETNISNISAVENQITKRLNILILLNALAGPLQRYLTPALSNKISSSNYSI